MTASVSIAGVAAYILARESTMVALQRIFTHGWSVL